MNGGLGRLAPVEVIRDAVVHRMQAPIERLRGLLGPVGHDVMRRRIALVEAGLGRAEYFRRLRLPGPRRTRHHGAVGNAAFLERPLGAGMTVRAICFAGFSSFSPRSASA